MEECQIFQFSCGGIDCHICRNKLLYLGFVPINLAIVQIVVFPCKAEDVAVNIAMAVQSDDCLGDDAGAIFHFDDVVAISFVIAVEAFVEQAILEVLALIVVTDVFT